jgi:acyl-CoA-binding protein
MVDLKKWESWIQHKGLSPQQARALYIEKVKKLSKNYDAIMESEKIKYYKNK